MQIKINRINPEVKLPTRKHYNDAGIDCYALADITLPALNVSEGYNAQLIPLGFSLEIPDGYMATIRPRSSMNTKDIITQIGTIDSGYHGEIKCVLINLNKVPYVIHKGDRICQIVIEAVTLGDFVEELDNNRGDGGFGSTGK